MKAYTIINFALLLAPCCINSSTITLRIRSYPTTEHTIHNLKKAGTIAQHTLKRITNHDPITGIFATYAGFLEASNSNGFIIFPRKQTDAKLDFLVTTQITPIVMFEQTIQNWEIVPGVATHWYRIERLTDPETELTYWQVQERPAPENLAIPLDTIIIIANPKHMYIPTGITLTNTGPNLVLPSIYARPDLNVVETSLYILKLAHLFRPANVLHTKKEMYYAEQIND